MHICKYLKKTGGQSCKDNGNIRLEERNRTVFNQAVCNNHVTNVKRMTNDAITKRCFIYPYQAMNENTDVHLTLLATNGERQKRHMNKQ